MRPPFFSRALLFALAGAAEAECVAGDLEEEFSLLLQSGGAFAAARWHVSQVVRSAWPLLQLRVRSGEMTRTALLAAFGIAAPLLALDKLWQFVYSRVPFKNGLDRAPQFLLFNFILVCACAAAAGAWSSVHDGSRSRALGLALAAGCGALIAVSIGVGAAPPFYVLAVSLGVPAAILFPFATRRSK
jgi:hypothetical protein